MTPEQTKPIYEQIKNDIVKHFKHFNINPTYEQQYYSTTTNRHSRIFTIYINTKTLKIVVGHHGYEIQCKIYDDYLGTFHHRITVQLITQEGSYTRLLKFIINTIDELK